MVGRMKSTLVAVLASIALLGAACSSDDDPGDQTSETDAATTTSVVGDGALTTTSADEADDGGSLTDVRVACRRGETLSSLPVDPASIGFLDGVSDETVWAERVVTIENGSGDGVEIGSGFTVRYLDEGGELIGEELLTDPFPPAFSAGPEQTVNRLTLRFDVPSQGGLVTDPELSAELFDRLDSCEVGEEVPVEPLDTAGLVDPEFEGQIELRGCGLNETGDRYEGTFTVTNGLDRPVSFEASFEILSSDGERLGIGGNEPESVPPGEGTEIEGWAAAFTVYDLDRAAGCELLSLSVD